MAIDLANTSDAPNADIQSDMSVQSLNNWGDMYMQKWTTTLYSDPATHAETDQFSVTLWGEPNVAKVGGLDSNEVAELVGFREAYTAMLVQADSSGTTPGQVMAEYEFSKTTTVENPQQDEQSIAEKDANFTAGSTATSYIDDDIIHKGGITASQGHADATNGHGGDGTAGHNVRDWTWFRDTIGRGPLFSAENDDPLGSVAFTLRNAEGTIVFSQEYHTLWDIWYTEDTDVRLSEFPSRG